MNRRVAIGAAIAGLALSGPVLLGACVLMLAVGVAHGVERLGAGTGGEPGGAPLVVYPVSGTAAHGDIPASYLSLYRAAAARFGIDWSVLAGIGKVECDHGRADAASCTVEGALNYAGAGGPAQFLVSTWQRYGVSATGDAPPDMWDPADAILSMANYIRHSGAPEDYARAVYAYNHAWWYVAEVMSWARRYRAQYPELAPPSAVPAAPTRGHRRRAAREHRARCARRRRACRVGAAVLIDH